MKTTIETNRAGYETAAATNGLRNPNKRAVAPRLAHFGAPDLTQRPPRSPRSRLGGYSLLPRMLDKGRATLAVHG